MRDFGNKVVPKEKANRRDDDAPKEIAGQYAGRNANNGQDDNCNAYGWRDQKTIFIKPMPGLKLNMATSHPIIKVSA